MAVPDELWVGLTGTARAITDQPTAQADIAEMARRYDAGRARGCRAPASATRFAKQERISFRVTVEKVHEHFD